MTIKDKLLKYSKFKGYSVNAFCKELGVSSTFFARNGGITTEILAAILYKCKDINPDWLLLDMGEMLRDPREFSHENGGKTALPLIPSGAVAGLPAGESIGVTAPDCERYDVPEFASRGAEFLIRVSGSSMWPKYSNGDILACRRIADILFFQWGKVYVLDTSQGVLVKRVQRSEDPGSVTLVSENSERYAPFDIPRSDIRSLSIVVGVIRME